MKYGRYPPHRIRDRANLFAPPLQSKNTPTNRRVPFVRDDFTFYSWLVRNSNSSAIFFTDAISAVNASYGDAAPFARYLRSFRCANRKQESIRSISNLSVKFSRNFCKLFTNTTTTKWWRTRRCYEAGPMNFLIYRPWKQIIGDCACARREKSPECGGEGGKWRRRRRGSEKGRRSRDLSISRGQGNFLNYIALIGLTASLLFPRSIFPLSDRGLPASRPLAEKSVARSSDGNVAMELKISPKRTRRHEVERFDRDYKIPWPRPSTPVGHFLRQDDDRSVVRFAASRSRDHRRKELFRTTRNRERTGFLGQYILHIERENLSFDSNHPFLPTLYNVPPLYAPSLCRDKRNCERNGENPCIKFVDRSEPRRYIYSREIAPNF